MTSNPIPRGSRPVTFIIQSSPDLVSIFGTEFGLDLTHAGLYHRRPGHVRANKPDPIPPLVGLGVH